ncbi:MAG: hypothetical protein WCK90_05220 [archaeon]
MKKGIVLSLFTVLVGFVLLVNLSSALTYNSTQCYATCLAPGTTSKCSDPRSCGTWLGTNGTIVSTPNSTYSGTCSVYVNLCDGNNAWTSCSASCISQNIPIIEPVVVPTCGGPGATQNYTTEVRYPSAAVSLPYYYDYGESQGVAWTNILNVNASDGKSATSTSIMAYGSSQNLSATGYGFNIPSNAVITGIKLESSKSIDCGAHQISGSMGYFNGRENMVKLLKNNAVVGQDKNVGQFLTIPNPNNPNNVDLTGAISFSGNYGGPGDLWGTTWTPANINSQGFGVSTILNGECASSDLGSESWPVTFGIDYLRLTVYYNLTTLPPECGHSCSPNQTIMSLYSQNNTHAALWNDTNYNYKICYTDFFPEYTSEDPHACVAGVNNVLYLSSPTNAHVGSGYTTPVCFGKMNCQIKSSCLQNTEKQIASVSGLTNAHIAMDDSLPFKLCCSNSPAAATLEWRNYYEKALSEGSVNISKAGANWTVKAVYSQAGLTGNVEFKIYKDGTISDDLVATINATAANGVAKANWPILSNSTGAYYFIVGSSDHSPTLNVQTMAGNKPPVANITSPVSGQIYFTGNSISINQDSYDEEGPLLITEWNVSESSFDKNAWSGNVIYAVAGSKPIKLIVRDKNNAEAYDEAAILVLPTDGSSVTRAFINSPKIMEHFLNYGIVSVPFNGSESFVVSSSSSPCSVTCLSGKCPSQTTGIPACSSVVLNVLNAPTSTVSYEGLTFGWTFVDGGVRRTPTEQQSKIAGNQLFAGVYTNTMELSLNYSAGGVSSTDTFVREFYLEDRMQCTIENGKAYFKEILGGVSTRYDAMVTAKCAGMDNIAGTGDDCCPFGQSGQTWACSDGTGSIVAGCYIKSEKAPECADYATQSTCMNDTSNAARYGLASQKYNCGENVDGKVIDCSCMWTASACSLNYTSYGEVPVNNEPVVDKSCVRNIVASEPLNGRITYTAQIVGDATGCTGPNSFSLPVMNRITLPVFGWVQALVAVIAIFIIYLIYELVKDRKGKKGKSKTNLNRRKSRR